MQLVQVDARAGILEQRWRPISGVSPECRYCDAKADGRGYCTDLCALTNGPPLSRAATY